MNFQIRKMTGVLVIVYAAIMLISAIPSGAASYVVAGPVKVYNYGGGDNPNVEPYIDALDCIEMRGLGVCSNPDTGAWSHSASIAVKGSKYGETQAMIKLRIEGKGDPVSKPMPQQTILITDDTGSMVWNDPNNMRFDGAKFYVDLLQVPDEVGFGIFSTAIQGNAELRSPLTTNYQSAKNGMYGQSVGATPLGDGYKIANDELIPKKLPKFVWAIIALTDGCFNAGIDPQLEVDRMINEQIKLFNIGLYPDPNSPDKQQCEPNLQKWSQQTMGKYYWVQNVSDLNNVYKDIRNTLIQDTAGTPPKGGAPMITFQLMNDISVVPRSFKGSTNYNPTNPAAIVPNNRGLRLEWATPIKELKIGQVWEVSFNVESFETGTGRKVNDVSRSFVEYDRFDGSPGGSDKFEQLTLNIEPDYPGIGGAGIGEPPTAPPPPPSGGIPQLIPAQQPIAISYLQNLPLIQSMTQAQFLPIQYFLGSLMGIGIADRLKLKSRIRQGVKVAIAAM